MEAQDEEATLDGAARMFPMFPELKKKHPRWNHELSSASIFSDPSKFAVQ